MFTTIIICKRPDTTHPFFFHTDAWKNDAAWQARLAEVRAMDGYSEEEILSDDQLTLTRVNNFSSQAQAEEIIRYNLQHFPSHYNRVPYAKEKGHLFVMNPGFNRTTMSFIIE